MRIVIALLVLALTAAAPANAYADSDVVQVQSEWIRDNEAIGNEKQGFENLMQRLEETNPVQPPAPSNSPPQARLPSKPQPRSPSDAKPPSSNAFATAPSQSTPAFPSGNVVKNPTTVAVQERLKTLNCYSGDLDGLWGPVSQRALGAAIGETQAAAGPTAENLAKLKAITDPAICAGLAAGGNNPAGQSVARKSKRRCMTFNECMARCNNGEIGRNSGTGCSYICDSDIPLCPK